MTEPWKWETLDRLGEAIRQVGPVEVIPQKTRIAIQAQVQSHRVGLREHLRC